MKEIVAKRIKSARVMAGLSLRELSLKMERSVSYNAIAKYEKAEMMPDSKVIIALSKALQVTPDFFFRPYSIEIKGIEFRKKRNLPAKKMDGLKEEITGLLARYLEIEHLLQIRTSFDNRINNLIISDGESVERAVEMLISKWNIGINAIPNVIEMLENKEIKVIEVDAPSAFDGLSGWANEDIPVIVINKNFDIERKRFTALHELGHTILQFDARLSEKEKEKLCHRFAGALLMPRETFISEVGKTRTMISLHELIRLKESYGISIQAIMARARDLGVINQYTYKQFCIFIAKNKNEKDLGKFPGKEHSGRFKVLVYRAAAEEIISISKAANLCNRKLAEIRDELVVI